jgi:hypothetical protein
MSVVVELESTSFDNQAAETGSASDVSLHLAIVVGNMDLFRRTPTRRVPGTEEEGHGELGMVLWLRFFKPRAHMNQRTQAYMIGHVPWLHTLYYVCHFALGRTDNRRLVSLLVCYGRFRKSRHKF